MREIRVCWSPDVEHEERGVFRGELLVANDDARAVLDAWGISSPKEGKLAFSERQRAYLSYHRNNVFRTGYRLAI